MVNKIDEMKEIIKNNEADIACVTVNWLSDKFLVV